MRRPEGEPWLISAVTTGTAVHGNHSLAIRNSLLEMIQIDSAMGHWYGSSQAFEIQFDARIQILTNLIERYSPKSAIQPKFYWLPNADLPGFTIACVLNHPTKYPRVVIGLGADTELVNAMYKSFLEGVGILDLTRINLVREKYSANPKAHEQEMFNLDSNINYYAKGFGFEKIQQKFLSSKKIRASELPKDSDLNPQDEVNFVESFTQNKQEPLFY